MTQQFSIEQLEEYAAALKGKYPLTPHAYHIFGQDTPAIAQQLIETMRELEALKAENEKLKQISSDYG